jgi:hypothetical protein
MSLFTMALVAVARDLGTPGQSLAKVAIRPTMRVLAVGAGAGQPASDGQLAGAQHRWGRSSRLRHPTGAEQHRCHREPGIPPWSRR